MHILVVEDNYSVAKPLLVKLQHEGFTTDYAPDGKAALEKLSNSETPVNMVILDVAMPVMDGVETLYHIKDDDSLKQLPVIVLTAKEAVTLPEGIAHVMVKSSVSLDQVVTKIRSILCI